MTTRRRAIGITGLLATAIALSSCGTEQGVVTVAAEADDSSAVSASNPTDTTIAPDSASDTTESPDTGAPSGDDTGSATASTTPATTLPTSDVTQTELLTQIAIGDVVNIDDDKPARDYDDFVAVAFTDIQRWWSETYPEVYGEEFEPLSGGIYAGYPDRQSDLPGCGEPSTSYQDLQQFVAFYCAIDDFMMYDDGDDSLLAPLTSEFGVSVMGVVLAHEYGHAIQSRIGALDQFTATIYTEQQADCFSGAWVGQAYRGESPLLRLGDADVRAGLIAMLSVRDPVGTDQFVEGGHGSAFDRVGAFQEGFANGAGRCAELLDEPLTLMPNDFQDQTDFEREGNASYDCSDDSSSDCIPAYEFLADDLNHYWQTELGSDFPSLTPEPVDDLDEYECSDGTVLFGLVELCPSTNTVAYDESDVVDMYESFGDFTLGYLYGSAWAERAQMITGGDAVGEDRALTDDCMTGAWVADITPDPDTGLPTRTGDRDGDGVDDVPVRSSPGDLDEAIRMSILVGDPTAAQNVVGSPFEKIASFRRGVLGGLAACA